MTNIKNFNDLISHLVKRGTRKRVAIVWAAVSSLSNLSYSNRTPSISAMSTPTTRIRLLHWQWNWFVMARPTY